MRQLTTLILLSAGLFTSCTHQPSVERLPFFTNAELTPQWSERLVSEQHNIAAFSFTDQSGQPVTRDDLKGKIHLASFIFTSCRGICPEIVRNLRGVQEAYADDPSVVLLSFSVTPKIDTVEVLSNYAREQGIDPRRWHLLTGERDKIYQLARGSYFADKNLGRPRAASDFLHTEAVYLVDTQGRIRGVYNGTLPLDMTRLIEDVGTLKANG